MIRQGERFKDIQTKKECVVKTITEDKTIVLQCVDHLSETYVSQQDLGRFFERLE